MRRQQNLAMLTTPPRRADYDGHPHHVFVSSVLACRLCMRTLSEQLDRRREMDRRGIR